MLLQGRSGSEIMRPGAKPAPRSHLRRSVLMAQECLPWRRPPLFLTILFQREGHCCAVRAEFSPRLVHFLSLWMHIPQCFLPSFSFFSPSRRLRHHPESALAPQPVHGELPAGGDRAVPAQEEAAHPQPADPAQPQRALRGRAGPGHQDPAQEMQLPQEPRVSEKQNKKTKKERTALVSAGSVWSTNAHTKF